jgi:ElaB/YqjD/DUF883 family membrane-anchored ribosome-binding protein
MDKTKRGSTEENIEHYSAGVHEAVDRLGEKAEEWLDMKDNWVEGAREYVREHPVAALGIAAAAGYILSMIMRSRG